MDYKSFIENKRTIVKNTKKVTLQPALRDRVAPGANLYTDALQSYNGMGEYVHEAVDHATEYVRGTVHTNGIENFWSLFKRTLRGTYVSCDVAHLFRYLDEQTFRFNNRSTNDAGRFELVMAGIVGNGITYRQLIGTNKAPKQLNFAWGNT